MAAPEDFTGAFGSTALLKRYIEETLMLSPAEIEACRKKAGAAVAPSWRAGFTGSEDAKVVVVGEGLGDEESDAGRLLTKMLAAINLTRSDTSYACLTLSSDPDTETAACHIEKRIKTFAPKVILALGPLSAGILLGNTNLPALRGRPHSGLGVPCVVTHHPSHLLGAESAKKEAWEDLKLVKRLMEE